MIQKILAVDDDHRHLISLQKALQMQGFDIEIESNPRNVIDLIKQKKFALFLLDVKMPGLNGIELFNIIRNNQPETPVIMVSGQSTINIAVDLIKQGAFDFIEKPVDPERLFVTIKNALTISEIKMQNQILLNDLEENFKIIGKSSHITQLFNEINRVSATKAKILITGESGTGKELVARAIHLSSDRKNKPYIKLNCAAIPSELLESELFGHKKGSFTGADKDKLGKFIAADGGTLFLDEIGDMSFNLQAKVLRVLEEEEVEVIGENIPRKIDVRIISATNQDLIHLVNIGKFRHDLLHRLNVINIHLPSLNERKDDIPLLADYFLKKYNETYNKKIQGFSSIAIEFLKEKDYPGNIRELRNIIEKLVIYETGNLINGKGLIDSKSFEEITEIFVPKIEGTRLFIAKQEFEKYFILNELQKNDWNITKTAESLDVDRSNLFKKMQKYNIKRDGLNTDAD